MTDDQQEIPVPDQRVRRLPHDWHRDRPGDPEAKWKQYRLRTRLLCLPCTTVIHRNPGGLHPLPASHIRTAHLSEGAPSQEAYCRIHAEEMQRRDEEAKKLEHRYRP